MSAIINIREFKEQRATSTLVLVDMHRDASARVDHDNLEAIKNCRAALRHARMRGFPVAFSRQLEEPKTLWATPDYPSWIKGFEPTRLDMIFDRQLPSCYANSEFANMVDRIGGVYVIAGLFGEGACLSTAIDAFHREHRITFLADASASRACSDVSADAMHRAVSGIMSRYAHVGGTKPWIQATAQRIGAS
jgi:nicotinamidase-related amidase